MPAADFSAAKLIAVDWGTSRLRAWLLDGGGRALAEADSDQGIGAISGGHEAVLGALVAAWPKVPAICAGMVGSRQGWREVAYVPCPADISAIAGRLARFTASDGREIAIVPGLTVTAPGRDGDVIRGEETQIIGLIEREPSFAGTAILPGTHSKWARVERGAVLDFQTYISGELFALLAHQSFLRHSVAEGLADLSASPDFSLAVMRVVEEGLPFAGALFSVRTRQLLANVAKDTNLAYLSGLVIGGEIAAAQTSGLLPAGSDVAVVGSPSLTSAYARALAIAGAKAATFDGSALVLGGLRRLARAIGWLKGNAT